MQAAVTVSDPHRLYYLRNFHQAMTWLAARYADILRPEETDFIVQFEQLPEASRALFVRMVMRKGPLFRTTKLHYDEIGCPERAVQPLLLQGWVDPDPVLSTEALLGLLTRQEIIEAFRPMGLPGRLRKAEMADWLRALELAPRPYTQWWTQAVDAVWHVRMVPLCERLRAMFFGNLRQQWSEFVLADLGVFRYETVRMDASSRPFPSAQAVDHFLALHSCRQALEDGQPPTDLLAQLSALPPLDDWLGVRAAKLRFLIGQVAERQQDWPVALACYDQSTYPGARYRRLRALERSGDIGQALIEATRAHACPESEEERQCLDRMMPRLHRRSGQTPARHQRLANAPFTHLALPRTQEGISVERVVQAHLATDDAPVFYVENTLVNGLFGLLCWDAIFAGVPGAFFHPFQSGPADLLSPAFRHRRAELLDDLLGQLQSSAWRDTIRARYESKHGIYSPFVAWSMLTPELLELALTCIAPAHLRAWFERLLDDIKANRTGWPDLIQFFPNESRYALVEVKGPGDRLQDNQKRWLDFCVRHDMPVQVAYVAWADACTDPA